MLSKCIAIKHERTKGSDEGLANSWVASPIKVARQDYVLEVEGKQLVKVVAWYEKKIRFQEFLSLMVFLLTR